MIKILINVFLAFIADILACCFVFATKQQSFDLKIFVVGFFFHLFRFYHF